MHCPLNVKFDNESIRKQSLQVPNHLQVVTWKTFLLTVHITNHCKNFSMQTKNCH